ncbi:hypothetical protein EJ110_NYTH02258 [Nymphaea thermarum]|nr:hypothetical protein EJ110_NYTH02258 [Nymphaea thermarum]
MVASCSKQTLVFAFNGEKVELSGDGRPSFDHPLGVSSPSDALQGSQAWLWRSCVPESDLNSRAEVTF